LRCLSVAPAAVGRVKAAIGRHDRDESDRIDGADEG